MDARFAQKCGMVSRLLGLDAGRIEAARAGPPFRYLDNPIPVARRAISPESRGF
jgi:hypothetical protein